MVLLAGISIGGNDCLLTPGDAAKIGGEAAVLMTDGANAEVLLFDLI